MAPVQPTCVISPDETALAGCQLLRGWKNGVLCAYDTSRTVTQIHCNLGTGALGINVLLGAVAHSA